MIDSLLITRSFALGFGASQGSFASWYSAQVTEVRRGYDETTMLRDMRLNKLTKTATYAVGKVEDAAGKAANAPKIQTLPFRGTE